MRALDPEVLDALWAGCEPLIPFPSIPIFWAGVAGASRTAPGSR